MVLPIDRLRFSLARSLACSTVSLFSARESKVKEICRSPFCRFPHTAHFLCLDILEKSEAVQVKEASFGMQNLEEGGRKSFSI